ncbi:Hypothetical predicted protein [Mytilus galloprovincialis]|uniref:Endonuclease/exonuclease/phosphatase domain-containing protein n=1 Tax=Mytilus galloprovincialis TaxID=29158 RepID=A0A8B6DN99_MYTGA|nr:Hypothetical predicted protein [Mytilus galloprovincialis]
MLKRHTEQIVEGFPMHIETQHLQSKIQSMENIYNLNRRVSDLEFNSLKQRLDALELSKQHWPSPQRTGNHQCHGYQNFIPGQHMNGYQSHIPNPHVNGYQNHKPAPQANGYQNHVPGLQVNGYQNHIPNPNSNGYQNYMHVPGPHGNGCHNHTPSSNADAGSYSNEIRNPQVYGYHLKPDMHMGTGQLTPNISIKESHQRGQLPQKVNMPHMHNHNRGAFFRGNKASEGPRIDPEPLQAFDIVSFNCKNVRNSMDCIKDILFKENSKIVCLQEHWLFNFEKNSLDGLFPECDWTAKLVDELNPIGPTQRPRGYGGVAILWREDIKHLIERT